MTFIKHGHGGHPGDRLRLSSLLRSVMPTWAVQNVTGNGLEATALSQSCSVCRQEETHL